MASFVASKTLLKAEQISGFSQFPGPTYLLKGALYGEPLTQG